MNLQQKKVKGVVDIVFLIDVTGSMQPCIDALLENISVFIDGLAEEDGSNPVPVKDWRAKVVGYRDFPDDPSTAFVDNPFVRGPDAVKAQLRALEADGGGDEPESLLDALFLIAQMEESDVGSEEDFQWRHRHEAARVIIVFTDASYHETMDIEEARGGGVDDVKTALMNSRIILSVFAPDMPCYDSLAELDKSEYEAIEYDESDPQGAVEALEKFTRDTDSFKNTLRALARSVSKSAAVPSL